MKYFTPELVIRFGSLDDEVADAAQHEWEEALENYEKHLQQLRPDFPAPLQQLELLLLHDAKVLSIAQRQKQLIMVLHKEIPPRDLVILTYELESELLIVKEALPAQFRREVMEFMYDEIEVTHNNQHAVFCQSILFSNGWEIRLQFSNIEIVLAEPRFAMLDVAGASSSTIASQSA